MHSFSDRHASHCWTNASTRRRQTSVTTREWDLPTVAVYDLVELATGWSLDRSQRAIGGNAERDQQGAEPVLRKVQQAPREFLVVDAGVGAADAEVRGGQHDAHRRLAEIELGQIARPRLV